MTTCSDLHTRLEFLAQKAKELDDQNKRKEGALKALRAAQRAVKRAERAQALADGTAPTLGYVRAPVVADEVLDVIRANPGIYVRQLVNELNHWRGNEVIAAVRKLEADGRVVRHVQGRKHHLYDGDFDDLL